MKDRIQHLSDIAYQNHLKNNPHSSFGRRADYDKEFAELIVRECVDQFCLKCAVSTDGEIVKDVMKHFGVTS
jgi:hypothetical protein